MTVLALLQIVDEASILLYQVQLIAKKAETKKRLLSDMAQSTVFDEKFEVSTQMEVDVDGKPTRPKMVSIAKSENVVLH